MELEPKKLDSGWMKRHSKSALELMKRDIKLLLLIFICTPLMMFFLPYDSNKAIVLGFIVIAGTIHYMRVDNHQETPIRLFLLSLKRNPQPILITLATTLIILYFEDVPTQYETIIDAYLAIGGVVFAFIVLSFLAQLYLLFFDIIFMLYHVIKMKIKYKKLDKVPNEEFDNIDISAGYSIFAIHLSLDTDMSWMDSVNMSKEGVEKQSFFTIMTLMLMFSASIVIPLLLPFFFAFIHSIYREIFWDQGIQEKLKSKSTNSVNATELQTNT